MALRWTAQNSSEKINGLQIRLTHCLTCDVWGLPHAPSKTHNKEGLQMICDSLPQEPTKKAVKSFTLWLKRCAAAGDEHFEHRNWLANIRQIVQVLFQWCCFAVFQCKRFSVCKNCDMHHQIQYHYSKLLPLCNITVMCKQSGNAKLHASHKSFWKVCRPWPPFYCATQ